MSTCPFCQKSVPEEALTEGHCPACGNLISWTEDKPTAAEAPPAGGRPKTPSWSPPDTDDPVTLLKATLERIASRDTEEEQAKTIAPLVPSGAAPSGAHHGSESGTMDFTLTPPDLAALAAAAESTSDTGPESARPTIVDSSALAETPAVDTGKKTKRGSDTPTLIPTVVPAGGKRPSTYDDRRFAATMDSGNIPADDTEHVAKLWQGTYSPTCTPRTSLKGNEAFRARDSKLVIKHRALREVTEKTKHTGADYELLTLIGEGGMGVVYSARQASIDRNVAVKMLKPEIANHAEQREKFLSEAVVTGDLDHPNIVPIYDLGASEAGALFYSMKRVQGTPWMSVLEEKSLAENVEILMKVADAVAFAHSRGVVHRDLKPENVMLGDYGEVLVMDWGLAMSTALFRKADSITQTSSMGGTPAYMAPEMATGPVDRIGPPADIYLLGAILYEIITGKPPHTGKNVMNCLFSAAKNEIQPTEHSGELLEIAMRAMSTAPGDRPASVQDFQNEIREYQSHSESIVLSTRAEEDLARGEQSGDYQVYNKALFGFQEAYALWDGNMKAWSGISTAKLAYARQAAKKEDLDLAASLLDADDPAHADLRREIVAAQRERDTRQKRLKQIRIVAAVAVLAMLTVLGVGFVLVSQERDKAVVAEQKATVSAENEKKAADAATKAKMDADNNAMLATQREGEAKTAEMDARSAEMVARTAEAQANTERNKAEKSAEEARKAREVAEYQRYIATIGLAAAKIDENSFDTADQLLDACPTDLRGWEWGRLKYLTTQSVSSFIPPVDAKVPADVAANVLPQDEAAKQQAAPVESVAYSPDGKRFISGSWDGKARIWDLATEKVLLTIPYGNLYVHSVAFSQDPDGKYVALGGNDKNAPIKVFDSRSGKLVKAIVPKPVGNPPRDAEISSVAFSRDGRRLLTASYDNTARLWDINTGNELHRYLGHTWWVWSAAFSPDESQIVTASQDGTVIVWNTETQQPSAPFTGHGKPVYTAAFSPKGDYVASAGYDNRVLVWRPVDVQPFDYPYGAKSTAAKFQALEGHTAAIRAVAFSPNGKMILSAGHDNTIKLWDFPAGHLVKSLRGHASWVRSAVFSPDGHKVLSGSLDAEAKLWSIAGYEEVRVFQDRVINSPAGPPVEAAVGGEKHQTAPHADAILSAAFSRADGDHRVVTAGRDRTAKTWDYLTGKMLTSFEEGHEYLASRAIVFPDGMKLLTAAADNTTRVWDLTTGTQLYWLDRTGRESVAAISHDGKLIITGSDDKSAKIWDAEAAGAGKKKNAEQAAVEVRPLRATKPGEAEITAIAFAPDDQFFVTGDARGGCAVWNTKTGQIVRASNTHNRKITAIALTDDGKRALTASTDNTVVQWDMTTGAEPVAQNLRAGAAVVSMALIPGYRQALLLGDEHTVSLWDIDRSALVKTLDLKGADVASTPSYVAVSADGHFAMLADYEHRLVRLWDLQADREVLTPGNKDARKPFISLDSGQVWAAAFSPDGKNIVTVGGTGALVWDAEKGALRMSLAPSGAVASANFSSDGKHVVTGSWDNSARIWNSQTGVPELKLPKQAADALVMGRVNSACFSPDDRYVLTANDDGSARLWDAKTGELVRTFGGKDGHVDRVTCAVFSPDGKYVLTGGGDKEKTAILWDAATGKRLQVYKGHQWGVLSVAYWQSDDGKTKRIITGSADNTSRIWDADSEKTLLVLEGHTASVVSVAFSPDGRRALTGSQDNTAKLWDTKVSPDGKGKEILPLKTHSQEVTAVAFSPDGKSVLTASRDGTAILWLAAEWKKQADAK
jgi:WD40 repeat protein/serine/threonine protein kinase